MIFKSRNKNRNKFVKLIALVLIFNFLFYLGYNLGYDHAVTKLTIGN